MAKESRDKKRQRKSAANSAARSRGARILAGEVPDYVLESRSAWEQGGGSSRTPQVIPAHRVVQAAPEVPGRALTPPANAPLHEFEREHYARNAPPR